MTLVNPRTGRTLDNIAESIGRASVRCGSCCHDAKPCETCAIETKLANWHSPKDGRKWRKELDALKTLRTSAVSGDSNVTKDSQASPP